MTTLAQSIGATDVSIGVTPAFSSPLPYPIALTIESERLLVRGGIGTGTLYVERGQDGTTAAVHALGTAVSLGWSSGGGSGISVNSTPGITGLVAPGAVIAGDSATLPELIFKIVGPFEVNFDDAGIDVAPGTLIAVIPAGWLYIDSRCIVHEKFSTDASVTLQTVAQFGDLHDYWQMEDWQVGQTAVIDGLAGAAGGSNRNNYTNGAFFAAQGNLRVLATGTLSGIAGRADIYAIIATPAS